MVRKFGGFTFQELALPLDNLSEMARGGADLSYDFVTRPAYDDALVTGDAGFLRLMHQLMHHYNIDPAGLIHALQNHDELTMGMAHFTGAHQDELFAFRGQQVSGKRLRAIVHEEMFSRLIGARAPYNLQFGDGVACTTASLITAALGLSDVSKLTPADVQKVKRLHLLLAFYNAFQPGVFALSGWDLVGALTLPAAAVQERLADGDTRWINRGAYDLLGSNRQATHSQAGLPRAGALYGPLPEQLKRSDSFASQLARMLKVRADLKLYAARLIAVPSVRAQGLLVLVHELPQDAGLEVTAINFGREPVDESVVIHGAVPGANAIDVLDPKAGTLAVVDGGSLRLKLGAFEGKALQIRR